jgi:uncharacterized membrane protein YkoI
VRQLQFTKNTTGIIGIVTGIITIIGIIGKSSSLNANIGEEIFMRLKRFILLSLFCGMTGAAFANDQSKTVALSETPAAVQNAIHAQVGSGQLGDIDKVLDGREIVYDVELTATNGAERDFTVDEDGTLLSVEVALAETPTPTQQSIQTLMKQGELESIDKNLDDLETNYDIELTAKNGQEKTFTIVDDGTLLSAEVVLNETPDAVQKKIATRLADGKMESIDENFDDDDTNYDVTFTTKDGREKSFAVELDGSLSSEQVSLDEVPAPAQRTIKNKIGDGKILRIDKSFVKEKGVLPYEVQGRKNGRPFDFSVGPRGKFLGMDD